MRGGASRPRRSGALLPASGPLRFGGPPAPPQRFSVVYRALREWRRPPSPRPPVPPSPPPPPPPSPAPPVLLARPPPHRRARRTRAARPCAEPQRKARRSPSLNSRRAPVRGTLLQADHGRNRCGSSRAPVQGIAREEVAATATAPRAARPCGESPISQRPSGWDWRAARPCGESGIGLVGLDRGGLAPRARAENPRSPVCASITSSSRRAPARRIHSQDRAVVRKDSSRRARAENPYMIRFRHNGTKLAPRPCGESHCLPEPVAAGGARAAPARRIRWRLGRLAIENRSRRARAENPSAVCAPLSEPKLAPRPRGESGYSIAAPLIFQARAAPARRILFRGGSRAP